MKHTITLTVALPVDLDAVDQGALARLIAKVVGTRYGSEATVAVEGASTSGPPEPVADEVPLLDEGPGSSEAEAAATEAVLDEIDAAYGFRRARVTVPSHRARRRRRCSRS